MVERKSTARRDFLVGVLLGVVILIASFAACRLWLRPSLMEALGGHPGPQYTFPQYAANGPLTDDMALDIAYEAMRRDGEDLSRWCPMQYDQEIESLADTYNMGSAAGDHRGMIYFISADNRIPRMAIIETDGEVYVCHTQSPK